MNEGSSRKRADDVLHNAAEKIEITARRDPGAQRPAPAMFVVATEDQAIDADGAACLDGVKFRHQFGK